MLLIIDTTHDDSFRVGVARADGSFIRSAVVKERRVQSERLLPEISRMLKAARTPLRRLTGVIVSIGPGGFTSLRAGISTANTLSYALKIPIAGVASMAEAPFAEFAARGAVQLRKEPSVASVRPRYGRPPNITVPKHCAN